MNRLSVSWCKNKEKSEIYMRSICFSDSFASSIDDDAKDGGLGEV